MINLIPTTYRLKVTREYRLRLLIAGLTLVSGVCLVGLGLLFPVYLMVRSDKQVADQAVAFSAQSLSDPLLIAASADMDQAEGLYDAVSEKITSVRPSVVLMSMMDIRPPGLSVRSMNYTLGPKGVSIILGGVASSRVQLLQFKTLLLALPGVKSVDFPPSNLTASSTIPFSMKIQYIQSESKVQPTT